MGTISDKLTYLNGTKGKLKDSINKFRNGITNQTTFRNYATELDGIYDLLPKVQKTTSSDTLLNAQNGLVDEFKMYGNSKQGRLPNEYTQVDYIESSGTQYIDTGVNADSNLRVILDVAYTNPTQGNQNIGAIILTPTTLRYHLLTTATSFKMYSYTSDVVVGDVDTNRHLFDFDIPNRKVYFDGNGFDKSSSDFNLGINFWLFGRNSTSTTYLSKVKQWACKMYTNGVLIRDFIPCYRNSDNEVGLYDIVNGVFYTNQGEGSFTYGALAPTPDAPINIDVVTGEQTIKVNGKNLFNKTDYTDFGNTLIVNGNATYTTEKNKIVITTGNYSTNSGVYIRPIPNYVDDFNSNTEYVVSFDVKASQTLSFKYGMSSTASQQATTIGTTSTRLSVKEKLTSTGGFVFYSTQNRANDIIEISNIMISKLSDTNYEPYYITQNFTIKLSSKNLIPTSVSDWEQGTISSADGTNSSSTKRIRTKEYYPINNDTNYYISINVTNGKFLNIHFYDVNYKYLGNYYSIDGSISGATNKLINVSSASLPNIAYMRPVLISKTSNDDISPSDIVDIKPMIELGTTTTDFVEYYNYDLRKIDTYEDEIYKDNGKWYKKAKIGKVILNGSEDIDRTGTSATNKYRFTIGITNANMIYVTGGGDTNYILSDKLIAGNRNSTYNNIQCICYGNNTATYKDLVVYINETSSMSIAQFKTWLSTHNIIVYYVLATPTTTEITQTELINQLEAISVFTGTNYFTISNLNNVLPSLNVKRLKELDKLS